MSLTQITTGGVDENINIDSNTLKVDGTNNRVGIGTAAPGKLLSLQDSTTPSLALYTGSTIRAELKGTSALTSLLSYSNSPITFKIGGSAETEALRIDGSGRVGIGESSPAANLEITPGTGAGTLLLNHASGSTTDGALNIEVNSSGAFYETRKTGGLGHIWYAAGVERMRIDSGGRLLVGSSTVQAHANMDDLQVGDGSGNRGITISSGTSNYGTLAFGDSTDASGVDRYAGAIEYYHNNNSMTFLTSSTSRMTLDSSGRLLVGQSSSPSSGSGQYAKIFVAGYAGGSPGGAIISIARDEAATAMSSGDTLGELIFSDNTGGTFASVKGSADAAPGSNDFPGRLTFFTTADGASSQTERMRIDSSGVVKLTQAGNNPRFGSIEASGDAFKLKAFSGNSSHNAEMQFFTGNNSPAERMRIDSSGRLLVGTSSAQTTPTDSRFQVSGTGFATSSIRQTRFESGTSGPSIILAHARGSEASNQSLANGDELGKIRFHGHDGTDFNSLGAEIIGEVDGTPGSDDMPGRLLFRTTADGASSPTERMRINSSGEISAQGIYDTTSSGAANVYVHPTNYILHRSTSSIKYKKDVETLQDAYADAILECRPVWYKSKCANDNPDWGHWGFIAEEVEQIDPRLCHFGVDENGDQVVESVQYDRFVPHLLSLIKRQQTAIETLETKVAALEAG